MDIVIYNMLILSGFKKYSYCQLLTENAIVYIKQNAVLSLPGLQYSIQRFYL